MIQFAIKCPWWEGNAIIKVGLWAVLGVWRGAADGYRGLLWRDRASVSRVLRDVQMPSRKLIDAYHLIRVATNGQDERSPEEKEANHYHQQFRKRQTVWGSEEPGLAARLDLLRWLYLDQMETDMLWFYTGLRDEGWILTTLMPFLIFHWCGEYRTRRSGRRRIEFAECNRDRRLACMLIL